MKLVKSTIDNIPAIMDIVSDAQKYLASLGIDQWQDGYPDIAQIEKDIDDSDSYLVIDDGHNVMATTVFTTKTEITYDKIKGEWLTPKEAVYGVIHRMAVSSEYRKLGLAQFIFDECHRMLEEMNVKSMRIDTHKENIGMQSLLKKYNYNYCGVIYVDRGGERLAFEKFII